jgi:hypothetical protein
VVEGAAQSATARLPPRAPPAKPTAERPIVLNTLKVGCTEPVIQPSDATNQPELPTVLVHGACRRGSALAWPRAATHLRIASTWSKASHPGCYAVHCCLLSNTIGSTYPSLSLSSRLNAGVVEVRYEADVPVTLSSILEKALPMSLFRRPPSPAGGPAPSGQAGSAQEGNGAAAAAEAALSMPTKQETPQQDLGVDAESAVAGSGQPTPHRELLQGCICICCLL